MGKPASCSTCRFFQRDPSAIASLCLRFPPIPLFDPRPTMVSSHFPTVMPYGRCGEHAPIRAASLLLRLLSLFTRKPQD